MTNASKLAAFGNEAVFSPLGLRPSFGFGDRVGFATVGHIEALRRTKAGIAPILAQQSARELVRTGRTHEQVVTAAASGMRATGWPDPVGADADHVKTKASVDSAAAAGCTWYTIDPSDSVGTSDETGEDAEPSTWRTAYCGEVRLATGALISFTDDVRRRVAAKYARAIAATVDVANHIRMCHEANGRDYEIEVSIDETSEPTTLAEHFIVASECLKSGVKLVAVAPRLVGEVEKAVEYRGDLAALEKWLADHAAIADLLGPYKLSLHSGSDKLSIYPILARVTRGRFHVKTSGTSYLEALRVVLRHDPKLFRRIVSVSRRSFEADRATYDVSASLDRIPNAGDVASDAKLEEIYLGTWENVIPGHGFTAAGRQILHCSFGTVLSDAELRPALEDVLERHAATHCELLADHFARHLGALDAGM